MGVEPKIGGFYPQNGWFISWKTLLKIDDLGVPPGATLTTQLPRPEAAGLVAAARSTRRLGGQGA